MQFYERAADVELGFLSSAALELADVGLAASGLPRDLALRETRALQLDDDDLPIH